MPCIECARWTPVDHPRARGELAGQGILVQLGYRRRLRERAGTVQVHYASNVRGTRWQLAQQLLYEPGLIESQQRVVMTLVADRGARLAAQAGASAQRTTDVGGPHLDVVAQAEHLAHAVMQILRAGVRLDSEIRAGEISDEQRVTTQHQPWVLAAGDISDDDRHVLRAVARGRPGLQPQRTDRDRLAGRELGGAGSVRGIEIRCATRRRVSACPGSRSQAFAARDVIGVQVRVQYVHDLHALFRGQLHVCVHIPAGIDHHGLTGVGQEIRRAAEVAIQDLAEDHLRASLP
jgi:hypothetical protein